jgi:hypothetical protein
VGPPNTAARPAGVPEGPPGLDDGDDDAAPHRLPVGVQLDIDVA